MTRPSLAGIEQRTAAATEEPWIVDPDDPEIVMHPDKGTDAWDGFAIAKIVDHDGGMFPREHNGAFIAHARTDLPALTAAVRDVLALHVEATCSRGYPQAYCMDCGQTWPCTTVRALAAHLDLTDPEGDPT